MKETELTLVTKWTNWWKPRVLSVPSSCCYMTLTMQSLSSILLLYSDIVQSGSQVILTCMYKISPGEYIDSIKWYLNTSEIYRILPGLTHRDRSDLSEYWIGF